MMKLLFCAFLACIAFLIGSPAHAQRSNRSLLGDVPVRSYFRRDGTFVDSHMRSRPDGNFRNNWTTFPNVNPYTGSRGTRVTDPNRFGRIRF